MIKYALQNQEGKLATVTSEDNGPDSYACNDTTVEIHPDGNEGEIVYWETKEQAEYARTHNTVWYNSSFEKPMWECDFYHEYNREHDCKMSKLKVVKVTMLIEEC